MIAGAELNVIPHVNPGLPHWNLAHYISGATNSTAVLEVVCFGFFPENKETEDHHIPAAFDSTNYEDWFRGVNADVYGKGVWHPLYHPGTGVHVLQFNGTPEVDKDDTANGGKRLKIHSPDLYVATAGSVKQIALIRTAATVLTAGQLMGWYTG